jgi:hypothetical protein
MPVLHLDYRHCDRLRPKFLKNPDIEALAVLARQQLVGPTTDAITLATLSSITELKVNGIAFALLVGIGDVIHDEDDNPVLGVCEYDSGIPDTVVLSVSPAGETASDELVLSTLAHETGHAIFDGPGWIVDVSRGPGLFDPIDHGARKYRTTTRDGEHLAKTAATSEEVNQGDRVAAKSADFFAELRANEFMGSLLVPRQRLNAVVEELAPKHDVKIMRSPSIDPDFPGTSLMLRGKGDFGDYYLERLQRAVATRFGVTSRFVQVRMERYGLLRQEARMR